MNITARSSVVSMAVVLLLLSATGFLARRPYYNWDMFPYMVLAMERTDLDFSDIHEAAYRAAQDVMLPRDFQAISARQPVLMNDATAFEKILPYYEIKPGYILFVSALYNFGVHPLTATWLPSILSYLSIGLMLYFWSRGHGPAIVAAIFALVPMATPVMTDLARYSSPDMLCAAMFLAGLLFILGSKTTAGLSFLTAAVTIRPDAVILNVLIIVVLLQSKRIVNLQALSWFGGQLALLYFAFHDTELISEYIVLDLGITHRLHLYSENSGTLLRSLTLPVLAIAIVFLYARRHTAKPDFHSLLLWAAVLSIIARIFLHPYVEDRFNLSAYLVVLVVAWETLRSRFFLRSGLKPESTSLL